MKTSSRDTSQASSKRPMTRWQRVMAVARVMLYCSVAFGLIGVAAARSAYGDFKESALLTGRQLAAMGVIQGHHQRVRLNGELVHFASSMTDSTVQQVLDKMEDACRHHAATMDHRLPVSVPSADGQSSTDQQEGIGILRENGSDEGWIGCLWQRTDRAVESLPAKLHRFAQSGDLSDIGDLRYVYARRAGNKTHVIAVWTDGPFHILKAFSPPSGQDTPGSDPADVPRPDQAQRLLSAQVEGAPYSVRIYDSAVQSERLLETYDEKMPRLGWKQVPHANDQMPTSRVYSRDGVDLLVLVVPKEDRSFVSIVEMQPH